VGAQLCLAGFQSLHIETSDDFGGVWYWNRYPGAPSASNPIALTAAARRHELTKLADKRVTMFRPGATAIQCNALFTARIADAPETLVIGVEPQWSELLHRGLRVTAARSRTKFELRPNHRELERA
jgi:hypothetical protein